MYEFAWDERIRADYWNFVSTNITINSFPPIVANTTQRLRIEISKSQEWQKNTTIVVTMRE